MDFKIFVDSFNSCCRVCLKESENLLSIYEIILTRTNSIENENISLISVFEKYCSLKIHKEDRKPQKICSMCVVLVQQAYDYFEMFLRSNRYMDQALLESDGVEYIEEIKIEITEDEKDLNSAFNLDSKEGNVEFENVHNENNHGSAILSNQNRARTYLKDVEKFCCILCKVSCADINETISHHEEQHGDKLQCIVCGKKLINMSLLQYHMSRHSKRAIQCKPCRQYFRTEALKKEHLKNYNHSDPLVCHICGKKFSKKWRRNHHMVAHYGEKKYKCSVCGDSFIYKTSWSRHYRNHFGKDFLCNMCGKVFTTNFVLKLHIRREHEGEKLRKVQKRMSQTARSMQQVRCEYCDEVLPSRLSYMRHRQTHPEFSDYPCKLCKTLFTSRADLKEHLAVHNKFNCLDCGKGFLYKSQLENHYINHKNLSFVKLRCSICKLPQRNSQRLRIHMLTHTDAKPCVCETCGKSFRQTAHLKIHRYQHTGKKPHKCTECEKAFAFKSHLESHLRIHTGEKPYPCPYCDKAFRDTTMLLKHKRKKHQSLMEGDKNTDIG